MYCTQCGKENSDRAYYCFDCGAPTQNCKEDPAMEHRIPVTRPDHLTCEQCGGRLDLDSKFCHQCGAVVQPRFCQNCGAFMEIKGNYCDRCGHPVADDRMERKSVRNSMDTATLPEMGSAEYHRYPHPYHRLGGWLMVCVVCTYIYLIAESIVLFISNIQTFRILNMAAQWGGPTAEAWFKIILFDLVFIAYLVYVFRFLGMIRNKDPLFLRNYHILGVILVGFSFFYSWVNRGFISGVFSALIQGIIFYIYIQYFARSVRVRTYMGSDEYLRQSIFSKDAPSPVPADTKPYEGQVR